MIASQLAVGMSVSAETIAVLPSADESEQDEVVIPDVTPYLAEITTFSHNDNKSAEITTGKCGDDVSYVLYADGSLYIFGSGNMTDYNVGNEEMSPFYELRGSIRRIFVEKGVTSVGNGAFFFILGAEEINLSEGLKKIGSEAFMSCNGVDKIYIPASVTEIGDYALGYKVNNGRYGSFVLNDMRIVGESGSAAADYAADENNSGVDFVERAEKGKCGENAYWVVDNAVGRLTVFGTGAMDDQSYELYSNASTLKSIVVEEGITYLGSRSFCSDYWYWDEGNYDGVEELVLPDSLVGIGDYALQSLNNLKELTLPKNLETIGTKAFGKLKIKKVFIPAKVSNVSDAFSNWSGLEEFEVSPDNESYASVDGLLYQKSEGVLDVLIDIPQATKLKVLKLPKTVTGIANINYNGIEVAEVGEETNIDDGLLYELGSMTQSASLKTLVLRCTSEGYGLYGLKEKTNVYVSFSDAGWKNLVNDPYYDLNWFDLDVYDGRPILTAPQATLNVGESMQLSVCSLDGSEAAYDFIVSTPDVAQTDSDGLLKAVSAGITDITAKAPDGSLSNTITVSVQGTAEAEDEPIKNEPYDFGDYEYKEFPDDPFNCEAYGDYLQIPCAPLGGVYIFYNRKLSFFSFADGKTVEITEFENSTTAYSCNDLLYVVSDEKCVTYDLIERRIVSEFELPEKHTVSALGADDSGRIYISSVSSTNSSDIRVLMYSHDGKLLDSESSAVPIYRFSGFNPDNGAFYMETYYDYFSWGYSHPGKGLTMGIVKDNKISFEETVSGFLEQGIISRDFSCLFYLGQNYYQSHYIYAEMLGGRYMTALSCSFEQVRVFDSSDENNIVLADNRTPHYSIGTCAVYNKANDSIIIYENDNRLVEYDVKTGAVLKSFTTNRPVFCLMNYGDDILAVEKDSNSEDNSSCYELIKWNREDFELTVDPDHISMCVGESKKLDVTGLGRFEIGGKWTSSDSSIASVTQGGIVSSWKAGETEIVFSTYDGKYSASCRVEVSQDDAVGDVKVQVDDSAATVSNNIYDNDYTVWSRVVNSYLFENDDSTFTRVEYFDNKIVIEKYSYGFSFIRSQTLSPELPIFGGFFSGDNYNYIVTGQSNEDQDDECEVVRISRYTKDWIPMGHASVFGANTYIPFDAGSLRMVESDGKLYIHTCHEMYNDEDDPRHHQANMTYVVNEDDMTVEQSQYDVYNFSTGYVSHSFNQFIAVDENYVYRVDHGDASPRAVGLSRIRKGDPLTNVDTAYLYGILGGWGDNDTGVSVGGLELSNDMLLVAGNSVDMSDEENYSAYGNRNIFLVSAYKDSFASRTVWLTSYTDDSVTVSTPQLVRIGEDQFLVMWDEIPNGNATPYIVCAAVDAEGNIIERRIFKQAHLSDCKPICASDGMVKWYVTDGSRITFYSINPYFESGISSDWEYKISYDLNGGEFEVANPDGYVPETPSFTLYNPTKTGYEFLGWTGSNGGKPELEVTVNEGSSGDLSFTANWRIIDFKIAYDLGDGTADPGNPASYNYETATFTLKAPERPDSEFLGWTGSNGDEPQKEVTIENGSLGDLSYKANWKRIYYSITYELNGGSVTGNPDTYTEKDEFTLNAPTRDGCEFLGWVGSNGSKAQKTVTVAKGTTGDLKYSAKWRQIDYRITYDLDGGTTSTSNKTTYNVESESFTLVNPTKKGFEFVGWIGSNGSIPEKTVTVKHGTSGNLEFKAVWKVEGAPDPIPDPNLPVETKTEPDPRNDSSDIIGDVDLDGNVTSADALMILRKSVGLEEFSTIQMLLGDISGDDSVDSNDALDVLRYSVQLPCNERIGKPAAV